MHEDSQQSNSLLQFDSVSNIWKPRRNINLDILKSFMKNQNKLPPSLPRNFPNHSEEDLSERPSRILNIRKPQIASFHSNFVKTSKYEAWNFIPKFLLEEFNPRTKMANCYFIFVACLQTIRPISNTGGIPTTLIPLFIIVTVDAIIQIVEDLARHRADTEANASPAQVLDSSETHFKSVKWFEIAVGDVIKISSRDIIPADVLILCVAEKGGEPPQGICYVETKSLDGETNLKVRNALPSTYAVDTTSEPSQKEFLSSLVGTIEMEHPNKLIESFSGVCDLENYGKEAIQPQNVLLRGCVLRNTDFVIGVVVNTGHDTKIMMSSAGTPSKSSNLENNTSQQIFWIIMLLMLVCMVGASGQTVWNEDLPIKIEDYWYLDWDPNPSGWWFIKFFYFFLLHATFCPVSLYVSMSLIRFAQAYFMNLDLDMYYEKTDTPGLVRTMTLNEELGQISHIFSDKTGTLTCNIMDYRKASIGGTSYGEGITEIGKAAWKLQGKSIPAEILESETLAKKNAVPHVAFYCPKYEADAKSSAGGSKIRFFYTLLACCHDIIPEHDEETGNIILSASNPDDEAIVAAAKYFGYEFVDREDKLIVLKIHGTGGKEDKVQKLELLETIGFTSKRKRMSVIVRDSSTNQIFLMTKGADSVMLDRLVTGKYGGRAGSTSEDSLFYDQDTLVKSTMQHMNQYALEGLRCLIVSFRSLSTSEFTSWNNRYQKASTDLHQIELKKKGENNDIENLQDEIEKGLMLVGCTAIEDRLQDGVPECIEVLGRAGINIWMLTGDKEETAINIAIACNLLKPHEYMKHVVVNADTCPSEQFIKELLISETLLCDEKRDILPRALVIDGPSLLKVMTDEAVREALLAFTQRCVAVVGCRVSPDQKKEMVSLIKFGVEGVRTLAIGDGANDVAMIQAAHIGVGIKGEEGVQAVNSSDYALAQFRFLSPLVLKHGRNNYMRMSALVIYMFYKNVVMSECQFVFAFYNGVSGQKYFNEACIQLFNVVFTFFPILLLGAIDNDLSFDTVLKFPQIYQDCVKNKAFTVKRFWFWISNAIFEAVICTVMSVQLLDNYDKETGVLATFWDGGFLCLAAIVIICNTKVFTNLGHKLNIWITLLIIASILSYFAVSVSVSALEWKPLVGDLFYDWQGVFGNAASQGVFWLALLLIVSTVVIKDILIVYLGRELNKDDSNINALTELEVLGGSEEKNVEFSGGAEGRLELVTVNRL